MTVNELMDMLSRMWTHRQINGDTEVRFSTANMNFAINSILASQETVYLCLRSVNTEEESVNT